MAQHRLPELTASMFFTPRLWRTLGALDACDADAAGIGQRRYLQNRAAISHEASCLVTCNQGFQAQDGGASWRYKCTDGWLALSGGAASSRKRCTRLFPAAVALGSDCEGTGIVRGLARRRAHWGTPDSIAHTTAEGAGNSSTGTTTSSRTTTGPSPRPAPPPATCSRLPTRASVLHGQATPLQDCCAWARLLRTGCGKRVFLRAVRKH